MNDHTQLADQISRRIVAALEGGEDAPLMTVREFCERNRISRSHLYELLKRGTGPRVVTIGLRGMRISRPAELEWRAGRQK